jgi:hypothetical protein
MDSAHRAPHDGRMSAVVRYPGSETITVVPGANGCICGMITWSPDDVRGQIAGGDCRSLGCDPLCRSCAPIHAFVRETDTDECAACSFGASLGVAEGVPVHLALD